MEERTNYATSFKVEKYPYTEFTCLFCMKTWYVQKILGTDNVWRVLPHWCRTCDGVAQKMPKGLTLTKINKP